MRLRIPKGIRLAFTATLAIFYLFLTGAFPSTARAVLMFFGLALGYYLRAEYDSLTSLSVALILLIILTPYSVLDLGMWMSFLAASSIIIFLPILQNGFERLYQRFEPPIWLYKPITAIISALYIGIVANLAMLVVLVFAYGEIAWMSVPATLLLSIPMSAGLLSALVTLFLPFASPLCGLCMKGMLHIADRISDMQDILLPANNILTQLCAVLLFTSIVFLAVAKLKRLMWGLLPIGLAGLCILSSIGSSYFPNHGVRMDYVSSSGGDLLLFTEQSRSVAVDFSDGTADGAYTLVNTAAIRGCTELDDLILTHYHNKDTYFLNALAATIKVRNLRLPMPCNDWEAGVAMRLCEEAEQLGIAVRFDTQDLAILRLEILANEREIFSSGRHTALLFSVRIGNNDFTYVNASVPSSDLFSLASKRIDESEILMLGSTGFSTSANDSFPKLLHTPDEILILDKRLIKLLPNIPEESKCKIAPIEEYHCYFP